MSPTRPLARTLRRGRRRLLGLFGPAPVDFTYSPRYQLDLPGGVNDPLRGERILSFLDATGLLAERTVHAAHPASFRHLRRVHTDEYLEALHRPGALTQIVGFSLSDEQTERVLEAQRHMVGGTLLAAALALRSRGIAVNLGGGLHHAFACKGERFCVFHDVAVAIAELRARGVLVPILIVDLDLHDGDGTRSIFAEDPTVHTFSIHNLSTPDERGRNAVASTVVELPGEVGDEEYLAAVRLHLPPVFETFRPELVFYVAGCDPAGDDRIGNWKVSAAGMLERDRCVLSCVRGRTRRLPLVIVLGGGYGRDAWRYSARFLSSLLNRGKALEPPGFAESTLMRYRRIARGISAQELTGEASAEDWGITVEDLGTLGGMHRPARLLDYYTRAGLELAMERTGFLDGLRGRGFEEPTIDLDVSNPAGDTVRVFGDRRQRELLVETRVLVDRHEIPGLALLRIEWLLLQNPRARFTPERPRLPGQQHPGLGVLSEVIALLILACDRLQLDGLLFVPAYYHTACQGRRFLRFVHPDDEARMRSLEKALSSLPLAAASHAVAEGRVADARTGEPFAWTPMPMVLPVSERLRKRVLGEEYERQVAEAAPRYEFRLAAGSG